MSESPRLKEDKPEPLQSPQGKLERMYIESYLAAQGYRWEDLRSLPEEHRGKLMIEAQRYATARMTEIEMRSNLLHGISGETV